MADDFNIWHPALQFLVQPSSETELFLLWAESQDLTLTLLSDLPTQEPNMIDLVWANNALLSHGIFSEAVTDLSSLADHEFILTIIKWDSNNLLWYLSLLQWFTLNERLFQATLQKEKCHVTKEIAILSSSSFSLQLNRLTACIIQTISTALKTFIKQALPCSSGHSWWNQDCANIIKILHRITQDFCISSEDIQEVKQVFKWIIQHSKHNFWQIKIDDFRDSQDIFKAVKWNQTEGTLPISSLREEDHLHTFTDDKASYLVHALLQKTSCSEDVMINLEPNANPVLFFSAISEKKVYDAIVQLKNSTPGKDGINILILWKAWLILRPAISTLYQHCLAQDWHPTPFQNVSLVAISKPGKRDQSSLQAYRLIALLSVLRKDLKHLLVC